MMLRMPARLVQQILTELTLCGMAAEVSSPGKGGVRYQPGRDISSITLSSVIEALDGHGTTGLRVSETEDLQKLARHLEAFRVLAAEAPENELLVNL
jgi:hypothetical protein